MGTSCHESIFIVASRQEEEMNIERQSEEFSSSFEVSHKLEVCVDEVYMNACNNDVCCFVHPLM